MANKKRGGLGVGAFFNTPKPSKAIATKARAPQKASTPTGAPQIAKQEQTEKLTVHILKRQIEGLEDLKRRERKAGKKKSEATLTALVIEAIDLLLAKRK